MGLEAATYIDGLVTTNPVGGVDAVAEGDDHIRLVKAVLKNSFPTLTGALYATHSVLANCPNITGTPSVTLQFRRVRNQVTCIIPSFSAVSLDTGLVLNFAAIPAEFRPINGVNMVVMCLNNSVEVPALVLMGPGGTQMNFRPFGAVTWNAAGNKGLGNSVSFTWLNDA